MKEKSKNRIGSNETEERPNSLFNISIHTKCNNVKEDKDLKRNKKNKNRYNRNTHGTVLNS